MTLLRFYIFITNMTITENLTCSNCKVAISARFEENFIHPPVKRVHRNEEQCFQNKKG